MIKKEDRAGLLERCNSLSSEIIKFVQEKTKDIPEPEQSASVIIGALHTAYHSLALAIYGKEQLLRILKDSIKITEEVVLGVTEGELKAEVKKSSR